MRSEPSVVTVSDVRADATQASLLERFRQMPPWRFDLMLTTPFVVTALFTTRKPGPVPEAPDALGIVLILAATAPFLFRRLAPLPVLVVSLSATAALFVDGYDTGAQPFLIAVGVYTVGAYRPLREVVAAAIFQNAVLVLMLVADSPHFAVPEFVTSVPVYIATILVGWSMQSRRLRSEALEREQGEAALRAAADERLRIAQELHDVIGHSLGVIAVQAGAGMLVIDSDPEEAKRAFEHISRTSRTSLAEIRRLLGLVRSGDGPIGYAPTPGLADLPRLADEVIAAGVAVELTVAPDTTGLPPGVELAAYRIVQEALTNVVRHAHAQHARVQLGVDRGRLCIVVTDDGAGSNGPPGRPTGHGLVGMRERVAVYGGALEVGPAPGGFRVAAILPYDEDPAS
jgi:signal transduction histidine kinase